MTDAIEVLPGHPCLRNQSYDLAKCLPRSNAAFLPFPAAGECVRDRPALEMRLADVNDGVMKHSFGEARGGDEPYLRAESQIAGIGRPEMFQFSNLPTVPQDWHRGGGGRRGPRDGPLPRMAFQTASYKFFRSGSHQTGFRPFSLDRFFPGLAIIANIGFRTSPAAHRPARQSWPNRSLRGSAADHLGQLLVSEDRIDWQGSVRAILCERPEAWRIPRSRGSERFPCSRSSPRYPTVFRPVPPPCTVQILHAQDPKRRASLVHQLMITLMIRCHEEGIQSSVGPSADVIGMVKKRKAINKSQFKSQRTRGSAPGPRRSPSPLRLRLRYELR